MPTIATHNLKLSCSEVENLVAQYSSALEDLNLNPDKAIGLYVDISSSSIILVLAAIRLGLKVAFCPLREPAWIIKSWLAELNINILICSGDFKISCDDNLKIFDINKLISQKLFNNIINKSHNFISYIRTSGTTSIPKSALISYSAHCNSAVAVNNYFNFRKQQSWALSLPIYHVSGLSIIFRALLEDAEIYIAPHHEELVGGLVSGEISHCSVVPTQVKRLLEEKIDLSKLRALIVGGDGLMPKDRDEAVLRGWPLYESYGMCETASMIAVKDSRNSKNNTTILDHAEIKINSDHEICVKATSLFSGYLFEGKLIQDFLDDGYFATGDLATYKSFSKLELINRKNNRIISGGENIQAEEIERALEGHPAVVECVVVPIDDDKMGARPLAFVKWLDGPKKDQELYNFLDSKLAAYKWPVRFVSYPSDVPLSMKKPRRWFLNFMSKKHIVEL